MNKLFSIRFNKRIESRYFLTFLFSFFLINTSYGIQDKIKDSYDFSDAKIVTSENLSETEETAIEMLVEETESRTKVKLATTSVWPDDSIPVIVVGTKSSFENNYGPFDQNVSAISNKEPEGFTVRYVDDGRDAPTLFILGNDARGMLFGIGYFLRKSYLKRNYRNDSGKIFVSRDLNIDTYPEIHLRGHHASGRPMTNSYDGFTIEMWEQYIRDLIVFGTNAIELLPPHTDDIDDSPLFTRPQMEMMVMMNELTIKYGLDSWIWYPLMYGDYTESENVRKSLEENEQLFSNLPKIDAVFVPGGDPGHQHPHTLFSYLEKKAEVLHKYHPDAEIWVSPQGFDSAWMDDFFTLLKEKPTWLTGIVYGPQVQNDVDELREIIPDSYPIRRYPDITHNYNSQYPVPQWDYAFAATQHRESINPRPRQQKAIFDKFNPEKYDGFITYSEGINDDVNKMIWSGLGWNPKVDVREILRDYGRYFIGPEYAYDFSRSLLELEHNWDGPLLNNTSVHTHHNKLRSMEQKASPKVMLNWRFQMVLFRSYYDAYNRSRLLYETQLEDNANTVLRRAPELGSLTAMEQAENILEQAKLNYVAEDRRQRLFELAGALFQSIRMQKSVDKYFAKSIGRGANLDLIDYPFNNRRWLQQQFKRIRNIEGEGKRLDEIKKIVEWEDPGAGGFYDDLGSLVNQPHLVGGQSYGEDPAFLKSPFVGFAIGGGAKDWRISWARYVQTLYEQPIEMHYSDLDPHAQYEVKVTYVGSAGIRLLADEGLEVHSYLEKSSPVQPVTFEIPQKATDDGKLRLQWFPEEGRGGNGRGCQVAEVWLMKKDTSM
ncbi:MAG: hypothetical protein WD431_25455 [Cyclobacteriaceae bacterium]